MRQVCVDGNVVVFDVATSQYTKRPDTRSRIVALTDANNIINVIPAEVDLGKITYATEKEHRLFVTDNQTFKLDINEFGFKH